MNNKSKAQVILEYASKILKLRRYFPKDAILELMRSKGDFSVSASYITAVLRKNGYVWHKELNSWSNR